MNKLTLSNILGTFKHLVGTVKRLSNQIPAAAKYICQYGVLSLHLSATACGRHLFSPDRTQTQDKCRY